MQYNIRILSLELTNQNESHIMFIKIKGEFYETGNLHIDLVKNFAIVKYQTATNTENYFKIQRYTLYFR